MESNSGLRRFLGKSFVYRAFQSLVGSEHSGHWLAKHFWKAREGMVVVDVGCGPADLRKLLPENITYFGFDPNREYIETAKRTTLDGHFTVGGVSEFLLERPELAGTVDLVICTGVLHHLTKEQMNEVFVGVASLLKKGGRFSVLEPTWLMSQDRLSRWVLSKDRGKNILFDYEWRNEFSKFFEVVDVRVVNRLIRIPYTYVLVTAWKGSGEDAGGG